MSNMKCNRNTKRAARQTKNKSNPVQRILKGQTLSNKENKGQSENEYAAE